jgi:hypothetical protein
MSVVHGLFTEVPRKSGKKVEFSEVRGIKLLSYAASTP